jgi:hypothetical protein
VLYYIRRIFYQIESKDPLNIEAAKLFETDYETFKVNVKKCVEICDQKKYDSPPINADDAHAIRFSKLDDLTIKHVRQSVKNSIDPKNPKNSLDFSDCNR